MDRRRPLKAAPVPAGRRVNWFSVAVAVGLLLVWLVLVIAVLRVVS